MLGLTFITTGLLTAMFSGLTSLSGQQLEVKPVQSTSTQTLQVEPAHPGWHTETGVSVLQPSAALVQ